MIEVEIVSEYPSSTRSVTHVLNDQDYHENDDNSISINNVIGNKPHSESTNSPKPVYLRKYLKHWGKDPAGM